MVGVVGIHRHRLARLVELKLPVGRRLVEDGRDVHHAVRMVGPDAPADDRIRQRLAIPIVRHAHDVRPPGRVPRRRADEVPGLVDERGALHQRGVAEATVRSNQNEGLAADRAVHEAVRDAPRLRRHDMGPALGAVDRLEDARGGADQDVVTRVVDHEEAIDPGVEQADVHLGPVLATVRRLEHPAGGRVVVPAHVDEVGVGGRRHGRRDGARFAAVVDVVPDIPRPDVRPRAVRCRWLRCRGHRRRCRRRRHRHEAFDRTGAGQVDRNGDQKLQVAIVVPKRELQAAGELVGGGDGQPRNVDLHWPGVVGRIGRVGVIVVVRRPVHHRAALAQRLVAHGQGDVAALPDANCAVARYVPVGERDVGDGGTRREHRRLGK
mmetsp:Transcript_39335/g.103168  ORF Transcript_39335/g.103168 Transcript_39335/m.103168 type:complete len:379 (-) Transcript_39335:152-1288(-)